MWTIEQAFIEIDTLRKRIRSVAGALSGYVKTTAIKNNLTTTASGSVLDARQGKALKDSIDTLKVPAGDQQYIFSGAGYLTSNKTAIGITIPINKIISGMTISAVTVNALQVRQNGTTVYNSSTPTDVVATCALEGCGISFTLKKQVDNADVAWSDSATNNDTIGIYIKFTVTWSAA